VLFVSPTSYKNNNTMNIYVRISRRKLRFLTHLFQETKLLYAISRIILSTLHTRNIFFTHICCKANWTQLRSTQLVLETFNVHHRTNYTYHGPLKQMNFSTKNKLIVFHKLGNIQYTLKFYSYTTTKCGCYSLVLIP
jgi:hypothetical protein